MIDYLIAEREIEIVWAEIVYFRMERRAATMQAKKNKCKIRLNRVEILIKEPVNSIYFFLLESRESEREAKSREILQSGPK